MGKESNEYKMIKKILSEYSKTPYIKEEIKEKIKKALGGDNYIEAVTAYLWGAYNNFDSDAKVAFQEIFFDDLRIHNPTAFYFFSYYYLNDFKRTGFDRRTDSDRRESYSLDFFSDIITERRQGTERRKSRETRSNWTRISKWVSVPFKSTDSKSRGGDITNSLFEDNTQPPDNSVGKTFPSGVGMDIRSLNAILYSLIIYFENYMEPGQTDWLNSLNEEIFERAKKVMLNIIDRSVTSGRE